MLSEDNVRGKLNDICFEELSSDYEAEQAGLESKLEQWQAELDEQEQHAEDLERFIRKCKQYIDLTELTPTILNDLVSKVFVDAPDKSGGKCRQNIHINYDLLGILPELNTPAQEEMAWLLRYATLRNKSRLMPDYLFPSFLLPFGIYVRLT